MKYNSSSTRTGSHRVTAFITVLARTAFAAACASGLCIAGCSARGIGGNVDAVYTESAKHRTLDGNTPLSPVAFIRNENTPTDEDIIRMTDDSIRTILGSKGLSALIKKGNRVVIKVNMVGPGYGAPGEKGRGIITDPRVVRHVAEKIREIIGFDGGADLIVTDALFYGGSNPSDRSQSTSFHHAYFDRNHNGSIDQDDSCYDYDADGYLDGSSRARLVNLDAIPESERFRTVITEPVIGRAEILLPKFLRTKEQAHGESEYCDVYIGLPVFKSHGFTGVTGALKLHYGLTPGVLNRTRHAGYGWGTGDIRCLLDWICALNRARPFDLVIMDALTGNRKGPLNGSLRTDAYDFKADWIETNAILCSRDSAAIDTVETLFAGYSLASIPLLESAFRDNIGMTRPGYIDLSGYDEFFTHRQSLRTRNGGQDSGRYPFADKWGNALTYSDCSPPSDLSLTVTRKSRYIYEIGYSAKESLPSDSGIARIDCIINGKRIRHSVSDRKEGLFTADLRAYARQKIKIRIAAWDNVLNCALSDEQVVYVQ